MTENVRDSLSSFLSKHTTSFSISLDDNFSLKPENSVGNIHIISVVGLVNWLLFVTFVGQLVTSHKDIRTLLKPGTDLQKAYARSPVLQTSAFCVHRTKVAIIPNTAHNYVRQCVQTNG